MMQLLSVGTKFSGTICSIMVKFPATEALTTVHIPTFWLTLCCIGHMNICRSVLFHGGLSKKALFLAKEMIEACIHGGDKLVIASSTLSVNSSDSIFSELLFQTGLDETKLRSYSSVIYANVHQTTKAHFLFRYYTMERLSWHKMNQIPEDINKNLSIKNALAREEIFFSNHHV